MGPEDERIAAAAVLPAGDVFVVMLDPVMPATRAGVAAALAGRSPLALRRACWGHAVAADGRVRVAMAHRSTVRALARDRDVQAVTGADILLWRATRRVVSPWWMLAAIPALTGLGAWGLAVMGQAEIARLRPVAAARAGQVATAAAVADVYARVPVSGLLARIEAVLPAGATLHALAGTAEGGIEMTVDTTDPGRVRAALARDPLLSRLRTTGQEAVADRGIRMRLRSGGR